MTEKVASLVTRLRTMAGIGWNPIGDEAADRIEVLEKWIREISEHTPHAWLKKDAKEILEGE